MKPWDRLLAFLRIKPGPERRTWARDGPLQDALTQRAGQDRLPIEQVETGLASLQTSQGLKRLWETLSAREQEVTALTCLGYTNRQMAARLHLSPTTVKSYTFQAQIKWNVHGKNELRLLLAHWDFSDWGPRAE